MLHQMRYYIHQYTNISISLPIIRRTIIFSFLSYFNTPNRRGLPEVYLVRFVFVSNWGEKSLEIKVTITLE